MSSASGGILATGVARAARAVQAERIARWRSRPVRSHVVLYESFAGNGVLCNPEAIFRQLLDDPDFSQLHHVWSIADEAAERRFRAEFGAHPRVTGVQRGSSAYWRVLSTAGYLVNNATFPPEFGKRPEQTYLNTWHGTPLKRMGFDMPDGAIESANTLRNLLSADYLLAANPFMAEVMYEGAYRLVNVYPGRIIEEGYPRIDRQRVTADEVQAVRAELVEAGLALTDRPIVLFAPTWRGESFQDADVDLDHLALEVAELQAGLGDSAVVLLKTHQIVHRQAAARPALRRVLVPNTIPANVLLGAASGLVADYSSIFFDFLATGRPIVFLTPDTEDYERTRGTYLPLDELPGPVTADARDAGRQLSVLMQAPEPSPRYREWAVRFVPYDDGLASQRVVDIVFRGDSDGRRVRAARRDGRMRLLLHLGGMRSNGITTSALNLLTAIDHTRYDVTAVMPLYRSKAARANQLLIPNVVRQVFRIGGMNGSKLDHLRRRVDDWRGDPLEPRRHTWHESLWDDEWRRVFGDARFDWAADFSGYSPFWANLVLHTPGTRHAIWLHNEMARDRHRSVGGQKRMRRPLGLVFSLYAAFDRLVSVSPRLTDLNRAALADQAADDRFVTVRNVPDVDRVVAGIGAGLESTIDADAPVPTWLTQLAGRETAVTWFVTVGRLSPEKNHARLIRAFGAVHEIDESTRLLIVGGGPLAAELAAQIHDAGLEDVVHLTGEQRNPFPILAAADCFVLSSVYEGQPMVLLEAALCGMPIVSTAFASVADALPTDTVHVVEQTDDALRDGMLAYLNGDVELSGLDIAGYLDEVIAEFDALVAEPIREVSV